ncbi:MAG: PEP-CTERM sorting domain-containing protein [Acidobacteriaceae bacterium]|nr:PEP-CTERM sorting domain-containing protein [Acidobacteriaceae bacterium]
MKKSIFLLSAAIILLGMSATTALANSVENLTDPFVNGPAGVTTANTYSGLVWIDITGVGQAAGTQYSDAFYVYTNSSGTNLTGTGCPAGQDNVSCPWHFTGGVYNWVLQIDGQDPLNNPTDYSIVAGSLQYNPLHDYVFEINLFTPGPITFGVADLNTGDNTGSYNISLIEATPEPETLLLLATGFVGLAVFWRKIQPSLNAL